MAPIAPYSMANLAGFRSMFGLASGQGRAPQSDLSKQHLARIINRIEKVFNTELKRLNIDAAMHSAMDDLVHNYNMTLLEGGRFGPHIWSGRILAGRPARVRRGVWKIAYPRGVNYADFLHDMRPHYILLKPGRKITRWWKEKVAKPGQKKPKGIMVTPTNYQERGNAEHPYNVSKYVKRETNIAVQKAITKLGNYQRW